MSSAIKSTAAAKKKRSRVIKISTLVEAYLLKRQRKEESFDSILRRQFGLTSRKKEQNNSLRTFFVVPNGERPKISTDEAEARGFAIQEAVRRKSDTRKAEAVILVREVPVS